MKRWLGRIVLYLLFLAVLAVGALTAVYYAGMRLPVYSDVVAFAFQNWNQSGRVEAEADYDASLVRRGERIHITVDLAVPETVKRLQAYLDGGRTELLRCGSDLVVYLHGMPDAELTVQDKVLNLTGTVDLEAAGVIQYREGKQVSASTLLGHEPTLIWAEMQSLAIEDLPDPLVEPLVRELARVEYTRAEILAMAAVGLSPELADLLARHKDALDLRFEDIVPGQQGRTITLEAVFSIDEATAFDMVGEQIADAGAAAGTALAELAGLGTAHAQLPAGIGDALDRMGGGQARELIEQGLQGRGVEDILGQLAGLANCETAF